MGATISIVTLSYNQAPYLEQCLQSVLQQSVPEIEYIVVDPGSTDGSRNIINRYRDRIDRILFEPDEGPADGLNKGLGLAQNQIFGYLNADDMYLPGALERVSREFRAKPLTDVLYGHGLIIDEHSQVIRRFRSAYFSPLKYVYGAGPVCQQATFYQRESVLKVGGFNPANRTSWDAELLLEMGLAECELRRVDEYLGAFRMHGDSISGSDKLASAYREDRLRYFMAVTGHEPRIIDQFIISIVRHLKWIVDPLALLFRLRDEIAPPQMNVGQSLSDG